MVEWRKAVPQSWGEKLYLRYQEEGISESCIEKSYAAREKLRKMRREIVQFDLIVSCHLFVTPAVTQLGMWRNAWLCLLGRDQGRNGQQESSIQQDCTLCLQGFRRAENVSGEMEVAKNKETQKGRPRRNVYWTSLCNSQKCRSKWGSFQRDACSSDREERKWTAKQIIQAHTLNKMSDGKSWNLSLRKIHVSSSILSLFVQSFILIFLYYNT